MCRSERNAADQFSAGGLASWELRRLMRALKEEQRRVLERVK